MTDSIKTSLKGKALMLAIDTGLILFDEKNDGYNIGPFLKFWDIFSGSLDQFLESRQNAGDVCDKERDKATDDGAADRD